MFKRFECLFCISASMISMAVDAGAGTDPPVKQNLGGIFLQQTAGHISDTDITLFVTADTLNRRCACERCMATKTLFFQRLMSCHQRTGVKQYLGKRGSQSSKNNG